MTSFCSSSTARANMSAAATPVNTSAWKDSSTTTNRASARRSCGPQPRADGEESNAAPYGLRKGTTALLSIPTAAIRVISCRPRNIADGGSHPAVASAMSSGHEFDVLVNASRSAGVGADDPYYADTNCLLR